MDAVYALIKTDEEDHTETNRAKRKRHRDDENDAESEYQTSAKRFK